ncbi:MAG: penicillin acylase family protein, partial [Saprospiraceae bacterium]|nr:penicillin acylase family protein [Saprospiraceae bacterium]
MTLSKFAFRNKSPRTKAGIALILTLVVGLVSNWFHPFGAPLPAIGSFFDPAKGFWQNAEAVGSMENQSLELPFEGQSVTIAFDDRMVPHIFAESEVSAAFAQGYVTAQNRLWQMDIATRSVSGRLSEILGERPLKRDLLQRRKGLVFAAERALESWKKTPGEMALIEAYTAGVNAWVDALEPEQYPLEFKLLGYAPESWTPL